MYNSTIIPKKKKLACGCYDYAFSKNRCKMHATIDSTNKRISKHEEQEENESMQNLIADLDIIFSQYIRLKYADDKGYISCYTSGVRLYWLFAQNGHFISRKNLSTRWLEQNCRPQSEHDNCMLNGNLEVFKANLEKEQNGITDWLLEQSRQVYKPTIDELKGMISEYRFKVKILKNKIR